MPISVFPSLHHGPPIGASWAASAASAFPAAAAIVALIVAVVVGMLLVITFGRLSWSSRGRRWRTTRIQRAAASDVAELQANDDLYDPNGPGLQEDEL
jgi:hypothetical protein